MIDEMRLHQNIRQLQDALNQASAKWDHTVQLCAVTKTVDADTINASYAAGVRIIGENRVQEAMQKFPALNPDFRLHMIGQLQTNKVKYIIDSAYMVQSLDRLDLAQEINKRACSRGKVMPALVQVNIAQELQKAGVEEADLLDFLGQCAELPGLQIEGLMAIMPFTQDPEQVRPYFRRMRTWFDRIRQMDLPGIQMNHLSMGMSGDCIVAAQEGATMVRVGSLIFGDR